jgi:LytS/YehU family sensor histidine kinase
MYIIQRYYHTNAVLNVPNISTILLFSVLTILTNYIICSTSFKANASYINFLQYATTLKTIITLLSFSLALMFFWIDQQKVQEERLKKFAIEKEREGLAIELKSLQQQFKPHFLFNSLNSINALTLTSPEEARKMIHLLSEFMRGSIRNTSDELVALSQEIHYIQLYTEIEKVRFGDRLSVQYTIDTTAEGLELPALILQPLIENSIKYGLYGQIENVIINIEAKVENDSLVIIVSNPFDPTSSNTAQGTGYGLRSIEKKMMILYHRSNLLKVDTPDDLFSATLTIPQL